MESSRILKLFRRASRVLYGVFLTFPVCIPAYAQSPPISSAQTYRIQFEVFTSNGIDATVDTQDVRQILVRAETYLNDEIGQLEADYKLPKSTLPRFQFDLLADPAKLPPVAAATVQAMRTGVGLGAIQAQEQTGQFDKIGVDTLMTEQLRGLPDPLNPNGTIHIVIVKNISSCPDGLPLQQSGVQVVTYGCAIPNGRALVLRFIDDKPRRLGRGRTSWIDNESLLWAHEIGHTLGLINIEDQALAHLPRPAGYLMLRLHKTTNIHLLSQECAVLAAFRSSAPNGLRPNQGEITRLTNYVTFATVGVSYRLSPATTCR